MGTSHRSGLAGRPRILVVPGSYPFDNVGDVAMCLVAVERVRRAVPVADLRVYAERQDLLDANGLGDATAVDERPWFVWTAALERWQGRMRVGPLGALPDAHPRRFLRAARLAGLVSDPGAAASFLDEVERADLIVLSGQGSLRDGSDRRSRRYATLLLVARSFGVPVVAVGQGIGPLEDRPLAERVGAALQTLHGLSVRDAGPSAVTIAALGLADGRWQVTGDDAIAAVLGREPASDRASIGVSLRDNRAASVPPDLPATVGRAIAASRPGAPVELISMMEKARPGSISDARFLAAVDPGPGARVNGYEATAAAALDALASCRLVISGTYHAAVFAQSLGIPVIGLASSPYYVQKLEGVLAQFGGEGGMLLDPTASTFPAELSEAIDRWWDRPDQLADRLRARAAEQAAAGDAFFDERISVLGLAQRAGASRRDRTNASSSCATRSVARPSVRLHNRSSMT